MDHQNADHLYEKTWREIQSKGETLCSDKSMNLDDKADACQSIQFGWLRYLRAHSDTYQTLSVKHQRHLQWRLCKLRLIDWLQSETIRGRGRTDSLDALMADREFDESKLSCVMVLPDDDGWMDGWTVSK